jgi:pyruvate formate lyase activating enzyme
MGKESMWEKKITRREFIKKGVLAAVGIGVGAYAVHSFLSSYRPLSSTFRGDAPERLWKWSKEAYHYTKLGENVQCHVCPNQCILEEDERSVCRNKINKGGELYTLAYGNPCSVHVDPIEKKPLFHFLPGSSAFSIATAGCTFRCLNCQNWEISQSKPEGTNNIELFPEDVVKNAIAYKCNSIAYTYSEPTAFYEYMYDTSKFARNQGIRNLWITNGSMNEEALKDLCQYMDAANVDLKSFREGIYNTLNSGRLQPVLDTLKTLKNEGVWFEVTNLVVPTYTDNLDMIREMCEWIVQNLGKDYPLHFSRFHPQYKLKHLPQTPIKVLEDARKIALDTGIKFVYIGNVPQHEAENTYCPKCEKIVIERKGYVITQNNLENGSCKFCGEDIAGVWKL